MCFISSFTSERVDLPEDEREESVAMAEGYNYIKTLPSTQGAITLPRTLRSPACPGPAAQPSESFYLLSRAETAPLLRRYLVNEIPSHADSRIGCLSRAPSAQYPWLPQ